MPVKNAGICGVKRATAEKVIQSPRVLAQSISALGVAVDTHKVNTPSCLSRHVYKYSLVLIGRLRTGQCSTHDYLYSVRQAN